MKYKIWVILMAVILAMTACGKAPKDESTGSEPVKEKEESKDPETSEPEETEKEVSSPAADYHEIYEKIQEAMTYQYSNGPYYGDYAVEEDVEEEADVATEESSVASYDIPKGEEDVAESPEHSETNVQVEGIDEGDLVKTDGNYIYVLHGYEEAVILEAKGKDVEVVSRLRLENSIKKQWFSAMELYITGDRMAIISISDGMNKAGEYDGTERTMALLYDISDRSEPKLMTTLEQTGRYVQSRLAGDRLYLISSHQLYEYYVNEDDPSTYVPRYYVDGEEMLVEPSDILCPPEEEADCYTVMGVYDLTKGENSQTQAFLGRTGNIYMNENSLYLTYSEYKDTVTETYTEEVYTVYKHEVGDVTYLHRYAIGSDGKLSFVADGEVFGRIYGQFALDEKDGYLRVVTTGGKDSYREYVDEKYDFHNTIWENSLWVDDRQTNRLTILNENMEETGALKGLAPGETVYSVRYNGDYAYFCTFRQVDPLFVVDVSDPAAPKQLDALKIPGFSEYLHVFGEGRLFGLGQEADASTGWTEGLKLTMFDTSDPTNIQVITTARPDESYSIAEGNHKAILIDPEKNLIGFPTGSSYLIYGYTDEEGFFLKAELGLDYWGESRGLYIEDYFYIVAADSVTVIDLKSLEVVNTVGI